MAIVFLADVKLAATTSDDKTVKLRDSSKGATLRKSLEYSERLSTVVCSADGTTVKPWGLSIRGAALQTFEADGNIISVCIV